MAGEGAQDDGHFLVSFYVPPSGPPIHRGGHRAVASATVPLQEIRRTCEGLWAYSLAVRIEWTAFAEGMPPKVGEVEFRLPGRSGWGSPLFLTTPSTRLRLRCKPLVRHCRGAVNWEDLGDVALLSPGAP